MKTNWTVQSLIEFEKDVAASFNRGEIKAPIHLAGGNERQLIDIFEEVQPQDWVCGTWRSHLHCLLKGVPPDELRGAIVAGRSIALCFPEQRVICSAMVGGIAPIALGLAWAAKRKGSDEQVWCFVGDMAAASGIVHECARYARGHGLPLRFVVEDNGKSVATDTEESWGAAGGQLGIVGHARYVYELPHPHVGTGTFVHFPDKKHESHGL